MNSVETDSDSDSDGGFAAVDLSGVDFDQHIGGDDDDDERRGLSADPVLQQWERQASLNGQFAEWSVAEKNEPQERRVGTLARLLAAGEYVEALSSSDTARDLFRVVPPPGSSSSHRTEKNSAVRQYIRERVVEMGQVSVLACLELELVGIAALNLFLQCNYTGPTLDPSEYNGIINPHPCFVATLQSARNSETKETEEVDHVYKNAVLAELSVEGTWPCPVCHFPYSLLVARAILSTLAGAPDWG